MADLFHKDNTNYDLEIYLFQWSYIQILSHDLK